jgi:hypothetical protein
MRRGDESSGIHVTSSRAAALQVFDELTLPRNVFDAAKDVFLGQDKATLYGDGSIHSSPILPEACWPLKPHSRTT